jgi:hypothetical protein
MKKEIAIDKVNRKIDEIENLKTLEIESMEFKKWHRDTEVLIEKLFGENSRHINDFNNISYSLYAFTTRTPNSDFIKAFIRGLDNASAILESLRNEVEEYWDDNEFEIMINKPRDIENIELICDKFHLVVRQLRERYSDREPLEIEDVYDVQYLFNALLKIYFEDIRKEEWTPSYAGGCSRVDFLLKNEHIIVEIKKTRKSMTTKELGEQLIIDISKYRAHPDCDKLLCFVYDPDGRVANPRGLEKDLSNDEDDFVVKVIVSPKGY